MYLRKVPHPPGCPPQAKARSGSPDDSAGRAYLVLVRDLQLASSVTVAMRSRLAGTGGSVPVLVPPMYGDEFAAPGAAQRLRAWWDGQRTGVELSAAALLIVDAEELAGLGRVAYVAVQPGLTGARTYPGRCAVHEVPAATVGELVDAVVSGTVGAEDSGEPSKSARSAFSSPRSERHPKPLWDRQLLRTAVLTGALGFGAWLLSAAVQPGQAQAATTHQQHSHQQQQQQHDIEVESARGADQTHSRSGSSAFEQEVRKRVAERLRASGVDEETLQPASPAASAGNLRQ